MIIGKIVKGGTMSPEELSAIVGLPQCREIADLAAS